MSQLGENPVNLLRDAGMVAAQLRQPNSYLSYEKTADLLDETARQCREPLFGLRLASCQNLLAIGEVALSGSGQATVADALDFARQYLYLHASGLHLERSKRGERAEVRLEFRLHQRARLTALQACSVRCNCSMRVKRLTGVDSPHIRLHLQQGAEEPCGRPMRMARCDLTAHSTASAFLLSTSNARRRPMKT